MGLDCWEDEDPPPRREEFATHTGKCNLNRVIIVVFLGCVCAFSVVAQDAPEMAPRLEPAGPRGEFFQDLKELGRKVLSLANAITRGISLAAC